MCVCFFFAFVFFFGGVEEGIIQFTKRACDRNKEKLTFKALTFHVPVHATGKLVFSFRLRNLTGGP